MGGARGMQKRIPTSQQRIESGGANRVHLRNGGMGIVNSKMGITAEGEGEHVPLKVFDMHGGVRAPLRAEEMQGATVYRMDVDYHGGMEVNQKRASSKRTKSREMHKKSRGKINPSDPRKNKAEYKVNNQMYSQSMPLKEPVFGNK